MRELLQAHADAIEAWLTEVANAAGCMPDELNERVQLEYKTPTITETVTAGTFRISQVVRLTPRAAEAAGAAGAEAAEPEGGA